MFQHVKDFGHEALKDDGIPPVGHDSNSKTAQKMSKKDKKKMKSKGNDVRRNEYRF